MVNSLDPQSRPVEVTEDDQTTSVLAHAKLRKGVGDVPLRRRRFVRVLQRCHPPSSPGSPADCGVVKFVGQKWSGRWPSVPRQEEFT
jgi:hypothetical protein